MAKLLLELRTLSPKVIALWCAAIAVIVAISWFLAGVQGRPGTPQSFEIKSGESRASIGQRLESAGIIRSWRHFVLASYIKRQPIIAGTFTLVPTHTVWQQLTTVSTVSNSEQRITIPEGWRREQIADYLAARGVDKAAFLAVSQEYEGKLFPDTYNISLEPTAEEVVEKMTSNFARRTDGLALSQAQLILASIVEREAKRDDERRLIAGIYTRRLQIGMRLEADPTVQYGRDTNLLTAGTPPQSYWGPITVADYSGVKSPYNTYLNNGLPPGPIANPGLKSIQAVLNPEQTTAVFFFHTSNGDIITSRTLEEHNANKRKYLR